MQKRQFIVIGLGKFGLKLAESLAQEGAPVVAVDDQKELIEKAKDKVTRAIRADCRDEEALAACGVKEADVVIVTFGEHIDTSVLACALLKKLGVKEIIARASDSTHAQILRAIGVDRIVFPEEDSAANLAEGILFPGVKDYIKLKGHWDIAEIEIGPVSKFKGKTIKEIKPRSKYQVNILMIKREEEEKSKQEGGEVERVRVKEFPREDFVLFEKDILVVFGKPENLKEFERACVE